MDVYLPLEPRRSLGLPLLRAGSSESIGEHRPALDTLEGLVHAIRVRADALMSFWKDCVVAFAFAFVPVVGPPLSALLFFFHAAKAAWHLWSGSEVPQRTWSQRIGLFAREMMAFVTVASWFVRSIRFGRPQPVEGRRPVVAVHGICGHPSNMHGICRAAEERGHPTWSAPIGSVPLRPLQQYVDNLERFLERVREAHPGQRIHFVAHSMGGVVLAHLFARRPDIAELAETVDTLASPHRGTPVAHLVPGPEATALRTGSPDVLEVPSIKALAPQARVRTFSAQEDTVVYPARTSSVAGAPRVAVHDHGHVSILASAPVIRALLSGFEAVEALDSAHDQESARAATTMPSASA